MENLLARSKQRVRKCLTSSEVLPKSGYRNLHNDVIRQVECLPDAIRPRRTEPITIPVLTRSSSLSLPSPRLPLVFPLGVTLTLSRDKLEELRPAA